MQCNCPKWGTRLGGDLFCARFKYSYLEYSDGLLISGIFTPLSSLLLRYGDPDLCKKCKKNLKMLSFVCSVIDNNVIFLHLFQFLLKSDETSEPRFTHFAYLLPHSHFLFNSVILILHGEYG